MPNFHRRTLIALSLATALAGCGTSTESASTPQSSEAPAPVAIATHHAPAHHTTPQHTPAHHRPNHTSPPKPASAAQRRSHSGSGLVSSTASGHRVQPQPAPGSCHASGHGELVMPDRHCTPGAVNPMVTQANINRTICVPGYTKTIRPPESITEPEKLASMAAYGYSGRSPSDFEYDHLVSLELGGAVNDPRNLWPESGASPNPKDSVEDALHRMVCDGQMPLAQAQHIIATDWLGWASSHGVGSASPSAPAPAPPPSTPSTTPSGPNKPVSEVNCSDFSTHAAAQQWFTAHGGSASDNVAGLDGDHDGQACESLP